MITMKDVAREAGVSRSTVSLVLSGRDTLIRISASTRDHIMNTATQLGYRRNVLATAVKKGKTNVIGFIGGEDEEYIMKELSGINRALVRHNYLLKMLPLDYGSADITQQARQCVEQMVAGVICRALTEAQLDCLRRELEPYHLPVVLVDNSFSHDWSARVVSDDFEGERMAVRHLYELGHRRILHLTSCQGGNFVTIRRAGFIQGMQDCGLPCGEDDIISVDDSRGLTPALMQEFDAIMKDRCPTALVFVCDQLAMKFMQWTYSRGIRIPDDISVVGFANLDLTEYASPGLTTVAQPFGRLGELAAEKLIRQIDRNIPEQDEMVPVKLIIRQSTAKIKR